MNTTGHFNMEDSNYIKYRGKCKQMSEAAIVDDPTLTLIRGHYVCPIWGKQEHWWTVREDGSIHDLTKLQFPSVGNGEYIPFDGTVECEQCGKQITEDTMILAGRYPVCSHACYGALVGIL